MGRVSPIDELYGTAKSSQIRPALADVRKVGALLEFALAAIHESTSGFDKQIKGFAMSDTICTAIETRTSAAVCIKCGRDYQNLNTRGLSPAKEGAGYAGRNDLYP